MDRRDADAEMALSAESQASNDKRRAGYNNDLAFAG
jgi:hypothetical protein